MKIMISTSSTSISGVTFICGADAPPPPIDIAIIFSSEARGVSEKLDTYPSSRVPSSAMWRIIAVLFFLFKEFSETSFRIDGQFSKPR